MMVEDRIEQGKAKGYYGSQCNWVHMHVVGLNMAGVRCRDIPTECCPVKGKMGETQPVRGTYFCSRHALMIVQARDGAEIKIAMSESFICMMENRCHLVIQKEERQTSERQRLIANAMTAAREADELAQVRGQLMARLEGPSRPR